MKITNILDNFFESVLNIFEKIMDKIAYILKTDRYTLIIAIFTLLSVFASISLLMDFLIILIGGIGNGFIISIAPVYPLISYYYMIKSTYFKNSKFKKEILKFHIFMLSIIVSVLIVKILNTLTWQLFFLMPNFLEVLKKSAFNLYFSILGINLLIFAFSMYKIYYMFFKVKKADILSKADEKVNVTKKDNNLNLIKLNNERRIEFTNFLKAKNLTIPENENAKHTLIFSNDKKNYLELFNNIITADLLKRKIIEDSRKNDYIRTSKT